MDNVLDLHQSIKPMHLHFYPGASRFRKSDTSPVSAVHHASKKLPKITKSIPRWHKVEPRTLLQIQHKKEIPSESEHYQVGNKNKSFKVKLNILSPFKFISIINNSDELHMHVTVTEGNYVSDILHIPFNHYI